MRVSIRGLGYAGYPLAVLAQQNGHEVYGIYGDLNKLEDIANGVNPIEKKRTELLFQQVKREKILFLRVR